MAWLFFICFVFVFSVPFTSTANKDTMQKLIAECKVYLSEESSAMLKGLFLCLQYFSNHYVNFVCRSCQDLLCEHGWS